MREKMSMFEKAIKEYLDEKAKGDEIFAKKYANEKKSISECCNYIVSEVKKKYRGKDKPCHPDYVFGLAIHYYDEADIKVKDVPNCNVVVCRPLTDKEKEEARKEAERRFEEEKRTAEKRAKEDEVKAQMEILRKEEESRLRKDKAIERKKEKAAEKMKQEMEQGTLLFDFREE